MSRRSASNVVIHIGLHKTATTFMQLSVLPALKDYELITRPYTQLNHAFNELQYADDSLYSHAKLRKEIEQFSGTNLVLSDESFSGKPIFFSYINRSQIARRLKEVFPDAKIIIAIRDQFDIMTSHYNSYVKMPFGTKKIEEFFWNPGADFTLRDSKSTPSTWNHSGIYYNTNDYFIHMDCFKYSSLVKLYQGLFDDCQILLYEELRENQSSFLNKLSTTFQQEITPLKRKSENVSLTPSQLRRRRITNKLAAPFDSKLVRKSLEVCTKHFPPVPAPDLKAKVRAHALSFYESDNAELKRLLPNLDWQNYPNKYL